MEVKETSTEGSNNKVRSNPENMTDLLIVDIEVEDSVRTDLKEKCVCVCVCLWGAPCNVI
jgi:hypothetical protein